MRRLNTFLRFPLTLAATAMLGIGCGGTDADSQPQAELGEEEMISQQISNFPSATRDAWMSARKALLKYRDVNVALADGYVRSGECYEGKGVHFLHYGLVLDSIAESDAYAPEVLMYVPDGEGNWRLVAAEYAQIQVGQPHPYILGQPMDGPMPGHVEGEFEHYDIHVWLFQYNKAGFFAGLNPNVKCPQ